MKDLTYVLVSKGTRVFVFGLISIMTPIYLATIGYSAFYVGLALAAVIGGNVFSNMVLLWKGDKLGRKRSLMLFSALMFLSGVTLYFTTSFVLILVALFFGNVSTTGTEAGPFQSVETGILPRMVTEERRNKVFGVYNLIGYSASSIGAFAASIPAYFQEGLIIFRLLYFIYGLVGLLLLAMYFKLGNIDSVGLNTRRLSFSEISSEAKHEIRKLSALYSIDAFGGGFVSQSLLSYWFFLVYSVTLKDLGFIFFVANIITAASVLGASLLADRLGNLRTMVYTHLISNIFLLMIPLANSLAGSLTFLLLRQTTSQMDVPTRQAFMMGIFDDQERVPANAITNTSRIISNIFGSPITGAFLAVGLVTIPILTAGFSKITYDVLMFTIYRKRQPTHNQLVS